MKTHTTKEIRVTIDRIVQTYEALYKDQILVALENHDYQAAKKIITDLQLLDSEPENDIATRMCSDTEILLKKEELDLIKKDDNSQVAIISESGERIALYPPSSLSY